MNNETIRGRLYNPSPSDPLPGSEAHYETGDPTPPPTPEVVGKIHYHEHKISGPGPVFPPEVTAKLREDAFHVGKYALVRLPNGTLHIWDGVRGCCPDEHRFEGILEALIYNRPLPKQNNL